MKIPITDQYKYNKDSIDLSFINQIMILIFCVWLTWPHFNHLLGNSGGFIIFLMWLCTTDYRWLIEKWSKDLICISVFFITLIPYIMTGSLKFGVLNPMSILGAIILLYAGIYINHYYMYYKRDFVIVGRIALVSIVFYTIGAIETYIMIDRYYAGGSRSLFYEINPTAGGYHLIFSIVFICIACLYLLKRPPVMKIIPRIFIFTSIITLILVIISASYGIAILITFAGIILLYAIRKNTLLSIFIILTLFGILLLGRPFFGELFISLGELFEHNRTLQLRFLDLSNLFIGEEAIRTQGRFDLYKRSIESFLMNPLFGIYGPLSRGGSVGMHAGWFDIMAFYGLFTTLPLFVGIIFNIKKHLLFYKGTSYHKYFLVTAILFLILGCINSTYYSYQIGLAMYLVIPSIPFLPYAFKKNTNYLLS